MRDSCRTVPSTSTDTSGPETNASRCLPIASQIRMRMYQLVFRQTPHLSASSLSVLCSAMPSAYAIHVSIGSFERPMIESVVSPNDRLQPRQNHLCLPLLVFPFLTTHVPPHLRQQGWPSSAR